MNTPLDRLRDITDKVFSYEITRKNNLIILESLFFCLHIDEKIEIFDDIFLFKAINLSGISLKENEVGEINEGRYLQILAIIYDKEAVIKSKNISLGYFGRVELTEKKIRDDVTEFVLRWRFEKSFKALEHYYKMIEIFN